MNLFEGLFTDKLIEIGYKQISENIYFNETILIRILLDSNSFQVAKKEGFDKWSSSGSIDYQIPYIKEDLENTLKAIKEFEK